MGQGAGIEHDAGGRRRLALDEVAHKGGGWVDYIWPRPGTTKPVAKSSYAMEVKGPDKKVYVVDAQDKVAAHAGHHVTVKGTVEGDTLKLASIEMAPAK